jgi:hypothetical protein
MDLETVGGLLARHALTTAAGALVTNGLLDGDMKQQFVGAGMLLVGLAWSAARKYGMVLVDEIKARRAGVHPEQG